MGSSLRGAPAVRREKRYSAENGSVYLYYYCGNRPIEGGVEYVFEASLDGRRFHPVSVRLREEALSRWQDSHARGLVDAERYALAKMSLLRAFDQSPAGGEVLPQVAITADHVAGILAELDID